MHRHRVFHLMTITSVCLLLLQFSLQTSSAQMDWLKSGQEILGTVSKGSQGQSSDLGSSEITSGLKDALLVGTETVVNQLGRSDGFNADPSIHIPLPENMQQVKTALEAVGLSSMLDDLELKLNRAAEEATPPAKKLFIDSIETMTMDDAMGIYKGPDDAATRYFQRRMSDPLATEMQPIVEHALSQAGAIQAYDAVMGQYESLPFMPDVKSDLNSYVVEKGLEGVFHYLAIEEAAIRNDPVKRTTEILQTVFGK